MLYHKILFDKGYLIYISFLNTLISFICIKKLLSPWLDDIQAINCCNRLIYISKSLSSFEPSKMCF